jgi:hypothetical protein
MDTLTNWEEIMSNHNNRHKQIIVIQENQTLAAIMAFFFGGIGQLVQGRMTAGLLWLFTEYILGAILLIITFGLGVIFTFPARALCIVDAANYKPRAGRDVGKLVLAGLCLNGGGLILSLIFWGILIGSATN